MRKTKARSKFIIQTRFDFYLYRFDQPDYIELVEEGQKSKYAKEFEEYIEQEKKKQQTAEERKRSN